MKDSFDGEDKTQSHVVLKPGTVVQRYQIIEQIGAGGMGEVYLAEDSELRRNVALKFLPAHLIGKEDIKKRFRREAQAVAKLNHPNIVTIHEVSDFNGRPFFVMEHIEGKSLHHFAHDEPLPIDTIIDFAIQICQGLGEAHRSGIIHRDIKAANIAVDSSDRVRLLDFGLASIEGDDKLTKTGSTLGTVTYMSPEQVSGRDVDHRSDLFSLGTVLYELIAGRTPFRRENEGATLRAIVEDEPEPISRYKANVPEKLKEIIFKLLDKDREIRYQSAEGVIADLKRLQYDSRPGQQSSSRSKTGKSRKSVVYSVAAAALLIIVSVLIYTSMSTKPAEAKIPVLTVLPFKNLGSDQDEYFADGVRDEIGSKLSSVKGLRVISPRSADKYKDTDKSMEQIGQETGADYVLEATIRWDKSGDVDRIRITPRLTKTSDNYLVWADNYDKRLVQIFDVQREIAEEIVTALGLTLLDKDKEAPDYAPTKNMTAYNYYLRGLEISGKSIYMADFREAIAMMDSAIALDSGFAMAWAQKSMNHSDFYFAFTTEDLPYHKEEARKAAEMALKLDPNLPMAHIAMGTFYNLIETDYDKALKSFSAAKSEIASNAELSEAIGVVKMRQGKWQEALDRFEEAARLDPLTVERYFYLVICYAFVRDYDMADKYVDRALVLDPNNTDIASQKLYLNLLQYGTVDHGKWTLDTLSNRAGLADISTYELASSTALGLWRFIADKIDLRDAIENVRKIRDQRSPHWVQLNLGQLYDLMGMHDSAEVCYDSSRIILRQAIAQEAADFNAYSELGITYAMLGEIDSAIAYGKTATEMLSVDDCHW